ncbi:hypothetical protein JQK88_07360 [Mesorhizobium caraganae]|uniref:hypothetical protein n=1 Tax=Mesorhizobium caraganae TaxID=483206 RepID=UPI00193A4DFB|nr:hypothetical protein [Mesorhizobium caraganae]MBM2711068.1 hypothetical protein [Mesorhizobium caraganae]
MGYIIAHVAFDSKGQVYPVNCYRTDIGIGDDVVVRMKEGTLKWARVADLNYLNWNCRNTIECLGREATSTRDGIVLPRGESLSVRGMTRPIDLAIHLTGIGWIRRRPANKAYRVAFTATNERRTGLILMRKNGVDVQLLPGLPDEEMKRDSLLRISRLRSPFFEQGLGGSEQNVFMRIAAFAEAFLRDDPGLEDLLVPLRSTKTLPARPRNIREADDEDDLYSFFGGMGEPVYMGDGIWLTSGGGAHDWGR